MSTLLDGLLESKREEAPLAEDAGSRARWAKWEKEHGKGVVQSIEALRPNQTLTHPDGPTVRRRGDHEKGSGNFVISHGGERKTAQYAVNAHGHATELGDKHGQHGHAEGDKVSVFHPGNSSVPPHTVPATVSAVGKDHVVVRDAQGHKTQKGRRVPKSAFTSRFEAKLKASHKPLREAAEVGKPGTNWKQVTPENRKKVDPLVKHWMGHAHPFTACYNELAPEKGAEAAKRICAVVKDMGMRTTKWRKGGSKVKEAVELEALRFLTESLERLTEVEARLGRGAPEVLAESAPDGDLGAKLSEMCFSDLCVVAALREMVEDGSVEEASGDFDAGALLAKVRAAPRFREATPGAKQVILPGAWNVLGPPDDPNVPIEPGGVIEDDRTPHQQRVARKRANYATAKAAGQYKKTPGSGTATPTGLTGTAGKGGQFAGSKAGGGYLRVGSSGAPVQGVQAKLGAKTDGSFGAKTQAKVRAFQQRNGLTVDGVVGRQTFAALAGHKNAAKVKIGKLSQQQTTQLGNLARHGGTLLRPRRRRLMASAETAADYEAALQEMDAVERGMLVEAERATIEEFPDRVRGLRLGEVTRMPDGIAIRYVSTIDGRGVYQVGTPSMYGEVPGEVRYWDSANTRTPEEAIARAAMLSAGREDPESLGGPERYGRYGSLLLNGQSVVLVGVTPDLRPIVRAADNLSAPQRIATWDQLTGRRSLTESAAEVAGSVPFPS